MESGNYFAYSIRPGFHMDNPTGALYNDDLLRMMQEEGYSDEHANSIVCSLYNELIIKTRQLEGEDPAFVYYYYVPSFDDDMGSFTLCAATKVSNNGVVNFFAPQREYLEIYQQNNHDKIKRWEHF